MRNTQSVTPFRLQKSGGKMEIWELISELCKTVVTEQNVFLDILITKDGWEFQLMPMGEWEEDE